MPSRPELVERYGYDVKYASHALRLAYQGLEVARDGRLTLPMPEVEREHVLSIKRGECASLSTVLDDIRRVQSAIEDVVAAGRSPLPPDVDLRSISAWSQSAHRRHWGW